MISRAPLALVGAVLQVGCARPLLGPDDGGDGSDATSTGPTIDATSTGDESSSGAPAPGCHPSYAPCLPVVDDLDCPDVVAMGLAPVTVSGSDDYGLDADGDGIGCEP